MYSVSRRKFTSYLLRAPIFCQDILSIPVQVTLYKYPSLEFKVWKCPEYRPPGPWSEVCNLLYRGHFLSSRWCGFRVEVPSYLAENESLSLEFEGEACIWKWSCDSVTAKPVLLNLWTLPSVQRPWVKFTDPCTFSDHFSFLFEHANCPSSSNVVLQQPAASPSTEHTPCSWLQLLTSGHWDKIIVITLGIPKSSWAVREGASQTP